MAKKNFSLTVYDSEYMETNNKIYQENMEKKIRTISEFPDKVLLKILSLLPSKDVVATGVLSKRWRSLWKDVKTFRYEGESLSRTYWKFARFINRTSSVESLQLKINPSATNKDIQSLVNMAVARSMRELRIEMICKNFELPKSFYMFSQLETVILDKVSLMDPPPDVHLPCLKRLHLLSVKFSGDESVKFFLSICPILEELVVKRSSLTNVMIFTIDVPTLRILSIDNTSGKSRPKVHGVTVIHTLCVLLELQTTYRPAVFSFIFLDHLELCLCSAEQWNLLTRILNYAPRLRVLQLKLYHKHCVKDTKNLMGNQPDLIPKSLSSHLEILEWRQYNDTAQEREAAKYILANASGLKKATFYTESTEKHGMLKEVRMCGQRFKNMSACV
ncbi:FBD domain [Arabidopsis thaliana x Arabidopsis arenosa]|uniref:FBD domain n=1 Tax=Arabidopsis thaliana x Arabidopsis arenosa TaxID=1240361 RepID=A0A8T2GP49_9BRAS|nr:FBD domain [Arabidopsis thaliana x Arabidopsis arenosa]